MSQYVTCIHIKSNGVQCGSPALRNSTKCYFHHQHRRRLKRQIVVHSLDTKASRMVALDKLFHAIIAGRIDPEVARSLIYGIDVAQRLS